MAIGLVYCGLGLGLECCGLGVGVALFGIGLVTARCHASAVLAMGLCLPVSVSVSVCNKSEFY